MQHINDDIDELLRNAAENYPLKISGSDWESVAGRLTGNERENAPPPVYVMPFIQSNKRYRYLLLLLLIPAGFIGAKYAGWIGGDDSQPKPNAGQQQANAAQAPAKKAEGAGNAVIVSPVAGKNAILTEKTKASPDKNVVAKISGTRNSTALFSMKSKAGRASTDGGLSDGSGQSRFPGLKDLPTLENQSSKPVYIVKGDNPFAPDGRNETLKATAENTPAGSSASSENGIALNAGSGAKEPANSVTAANPDIKQDQVVAEGLPPVKKGAKTDVMRHVNTKANHSFYIGAFVAPDYTTVKYQPGSKIGFTFGGVIGYSFARNFDIELGISTDKKYYTSSGKYFNTKISWLQDWGKVLALSGYAGLTEFPLSIKYNFKPNKENGDFFASAGLVSSIVHEENYNYTFDKNGVVYTKDKSTKVSTNNFLSSVSISGGYESSLGSLCNFRIEPYYRIPIKGIGIGSLPITSIGLNIGITKRIK